MFIFVRNLKSVEANDEEISFFVAGTRRCCNAVDVASGFMKVESVDRFKT